MALSPIDSIRARIESGIDTGWMARLRADQRYLYGLSRAAGGLSGDGMLTGKFPEYTDLSMERQEQGVSRRVLANAYLSLARIRGNDMVPRFPDVPEVVEAARRQWWIARSKGDPMVPGGWEAQFDRATLEGEQLGVSYVRWGLVTNPVTGKQRVHCRHVSPLTTVRDPRIPDPHSASWVAFASLVSEETARNLFGAEAAKAVRTRDLPGGRSTSDVRLIEYYDVGIDGYAPTAVTFLGDIDGKAVKHEPNALRCVPLSARVHLDAVGLDHELGLIGKQKSTHEEINRIERMINEAIDNGPRLVLNVTGLDPEDMALLKSGSPPKWMRWNSTALNDRSAPLAQMIPGAPIDPTIWQRLGQLVQQLNIESGITGFDQGIGIGESTATANSLTADRSAVAGAWPIRQQERFLIRSVEIACHLAGLFDRDPLRVDLFKRGVMLNDPANPSTWMDTVMRDPSAVTIDTSPVSAAGAARKRMEEAGLVDGLLPAVQMGQVAPSFYAEQKVRALGFDPKEALTAQSQGGSDAPAPGTAPGGIPGGTQTAPPAVSAANGAPAQLPSSPSSEDLAPTKPHFQRYISKEAQQTQP